jgi:hypothetical protein
MFSTNVRPLRGRAADGRAADLIICPTNVRTLRGRAAYSRFPQVFLNFNPT